MKSKEENLRLKLILEFPRETTPEQMQGIFDDIKGVVEKYNGSLPFLTARGGDYTGLHPHPMVAILIADQGGVSY